MIDEKENTNQDLINNGNDDSSSPMNEKITKERLKDFIKKVHEMS